MGVVFDIETMGLNPYESKVILIGLKSRGKVKQWRLRDESGKRGSGDDIIGLGEIEEVYDQYLGTTT